MSMTNMLGSAKSGMGNMLGKTKSGVTAMVGSAKNLAQNLSPKGTGGAVPEKSAAASPSASPSAASPSAREMLAELRRMFPAWDGEAIKEVIINSKGNMDVAIQTMLVWTADDNGTSKAARSHQDAKANMVAEDFIPPPVEERKLLDTILEKRLEVKIEGDTNVPRTMQALKMLKAVAKTAQETVRNATGVGASAAAATSEANAEVDAQASRDQKIADGKKVLGERLGKWNLASVPIVDDGNCQFRSFSMELWGTEAYHLAVRSAAVNYLRKHADEYAAFVPEDMSWSQYLEAMARPRYWGDHLTLIAACQAYGCVVHMISTERESWHHVFEPAERKWPYRRVFLAYISPIHYNTIKPLK